MYTEFNAYISVVGGFTEISRTFRNPVSCKDKAEQQALETIAYNAWIMGFNDYSITLLTVK